MNLSIEGLDPAEIILRLYNNSKYQGVSWLGAVSEEKTRDDMQEILVDGGIDNGKVVWFDYLYGKVMKVGITYKEISRADLYDRDVGNGECKRIVDELREE